MTAPERTPRRPRAHHYTRVVDGTLVAVQQVACPGPHCNWLLPIERRLGSRNPEHVIMNIDLPEFVLLTLVISVIVFLGIHVRRRRRN
jgi:hypothetical protein